MDDKKLIKECQNGNPEAFNLLIKKYYPYVTGFLLKATKNQELTEDITQEVFLKVIEIIENFNFKKNGSFGTYIITIAQNKLIDVKRKDKIFLNFDDYDVADEFDLLNDFVKKSDYNELKEQLNKLPKEQKEAIKLKYYEELSLREIARIQNVEEKTIKSRIFEGKKKLKRILKEERNETS